MKFKSFAKKGLVAVAVTGALVMVSTGVEYKGDLIGGLNDKLTKSESMLGTYSGRYQKDKDTISKLQAEIAKLKEQLATSNGDKSDLETQLDKAEKEIAKYKADLTALAGALGITMDDTMGFDTPEKYEALKSAINTKIEALKANKVENEAELKAVADILGCAKDENGNYTEDISNAVQTLFDYYDEAQAEVTRLEGELEKANGLVTSLQAELEEANEEIKRLEGIIKKYETDLGNANTKAQKIIDGKQDEVDEIKGNVQGGSTPEVVPGEEQPTDPVNPPAESETKNTCEKCGVKYASVTEHKELAKEKLTGNAKTLADNGYKVGDLTRIVQGSNVRYVIKDLDKYGNIFASDLYSNVYANNGTTYNNVFGSDALTDEQVTNLNHWANIK